MAKIWMQGKEMFMCPVCENERIEPGQKYCQICGEALEWEEESENGTGKEIIQNHLANVPDANTRNMDADIKETIELLRGMQNPLQDYADMVGTPIWAYGHRYVYPDPEDYAIEKAISALEEQNRHRWIPVEERLPEDDVIVLVTVSGFCGYITFSNAIELGNLCSDGSWFIEGYPDWDDPEVTAWMPLPEPYQKEERE